MESLSKVNVAADIYESLVREFPDALQDVTTISRNHSAGKDFVRSPVLAFNFDGVPNVGVTAPGSERSPDALFLLGDVLYFVEFKEGRCERSNVRQKVHEGALTLFQYAMARNICSREDFLSVTIKFALVLRDRRKGIQSFLAALEMSEDSFSLKNMHGFIVDETAVRYVPRSIFDLLNKVSSGAIMSMDYINLDQSIVTLP
jgi:hypothetical protein